MAINVKEVNNQIDFINKKSNQLSQNNHQCQKYF